MPRAPIALASALLICFLLSAASLFAADPEKPHTSAAPPESFTKEQTEHWAYRPLHKLPPPVVKQVKWVRNPIDRFVLAALESSELAPSAEADRATLIRRLTYDLTGLPPSPADVEAFAKDQRGDAYQRVVDRLLNSKAYGERWAQHWLDLAHYADSNGFELDAERPDAWRYRDWVVNALNDDMPYDQFVKLQIAGDEIAPGDTSALIATGFGRCGPREVVGGNVLPEVKRQSELTEVTGTVGSVFLGLTLACARCHDHKFDALPTTDYYRLQSFFAGAEFVEIPIATKQEEATFKAAEEAIKAKVAPLRAEMAKLEAPYRASIQKEKEGMLTSAEKSLMAIPEAKRTPVEKKILDGLKNSLRITWEEVAEVVAKNPADHAKREELKRKIEAIENTLPHPPAKAMALVEESPKTPPTFVFKRGDAKLLGPLVAPRPPGVVLVSQSKQAFSDEISPGPKTPNRRTALANWLARADNPLTARVIVNRLWQHHFGKGIVSTPSDFGVRGEPPTHPELLDWLSSEFIASGWRLKEMHRLMVNSATYRQASRYREEAAEVDPENSLYWRANRRRMDAEGLRDAMLFVAGELNPRMGGPGVRPPIEKEVEDLIFTEAEVVDLWPETADRTQHLRRSLYLFRKRNVRYPMFDAFDAPDTQSACPQRAISTHALQALVMLNSDFAAERAKSLARRLEREGTDAQSKVERAYRIVLGRAPNPDERASALVFLSTRATKEQSARSPGRDEDHSLVDFCLAMLNRNEFVYVP